jgi:hypothetical protein
MSPLLVFNRVYRLEVSHVGIFDPCCEQAPLLTSHWFTYPPPFPLPRVNQKLRRGGGLRQINTCRQVHLLVNFKKSRQLGFGVFIDIWSIIWGTLVVSVFARHYLLN